MRGRRSTPQTSSCKAHGAAFAVPTYQSAWLKTHHPAEFLAGLWEHDPDMYPRRLLVAEARRLGIRLSLAGIYGLSGTELKRIVAGQPYDSLAGLRTRAKVSRPVLKRLAQLGALDRRARQAQRAGGGTAPTTADRLLGLRNNTEVLVAGVRVATQTPPMRGGRRVVFISVDDGTGCVDATFFHEAQERSGPLLFGTGMLLIRGLTRRTGPRGISLQALEAWDLADTGSLPEAGPDSSVPAPTGRPRTG